MAIKFDKLFALLKKRGYSSTYWLRRHGFHSSTVTKLRHNGTVTTAIVGRLCDLLECQPKDIMENVREGND